MDYFKLGYVGNAYPGHDQFSGMISVPYLTVTGSVGLRFKSMPGGHQPKMLNVSGWSNRPYDARSVLGPPGPVIICEGEPDTWIAHELGFAAVGIQSSSVKKNLRPLFQYRDVIAAMHNDEKGTVRVGKNMGTLIAEVVPWATVVMMPEGHDLNSYFLEYGEDETLRYLGI